MPSQRSNEVGGGKAPRADTLPGVEGHSCSLFSFATGQSTLMLADSDPYSQQGPSWQHSPAAKRHARAKALAKLALFLSMRRDLEERLDAIDIYVEAALVDVDVLWLSAPVREQLWGVLEDYLDQYNVTFTAIFMASVLYYAACMDGAQVEAEGAIGIAQETVDVDEEGDEGGMVLRVSEMEARAVSHLRLCMHLRRDLVPLLGVMTGRLLLHMGRDREAADAFRQAAEYVPPSDSHRGDTKPFAPMTKKRARRLGYLCMGTDRQRAQREQEEAMRIKRSEARFFLGVALYNRCVRSGAESPQKAYAFMCQAKRSLDEFRLQEESNVTDLRALCFRDESTTRTAVDLYTQGLKSEVSARRWLGEDWFAGGDARPYGHTQEKETATQLLMTLQQFGAVPYLPCPEDACANPMCLAHEADLPPSSTLRPCHSCARPRFCSKQCEWSYAQYWHRFECLGALQSAVSRSSRPS
ncbi:unnamed protein product [Vitrella brassicaformis CCMP3155]|uniref:Uncharacterized protein n=1 Tax=Vitrella brassicaformis (strain CCMP3155) TaxID=1169540 RepID=A0A0G4FDD5_VITBC|nr:unnamed protein product [Vitrella brassicaformis CCMP3155]|eukprot:CEM10830.1 unnamed protein product [Vitrella brassicaformis CCMP3155]